MNVVSNKFFLANGAGYSYNKGREFLLQGSIYMTVTFHYNRSKIQIFKVFSGTLDPIIRMHAHAKNGYEIHFVDSGRGTLETPEGTYSLTENVLFITGPNVMHKQISNIADPVHELCVYLKIPDGSRDDAVQAFVDKVFWIGAGSGAVRQLFRQIVAESGKAGRYREQMLSALVIQLIVEIARLYDPGWNGTALSPQESDLNESRSWILDTLLSADCSRMTLEDFASDLGVCPRQAERIIKNYYGFSFKKLRYESKMAMAASLLEAGELTIEQCAARSGYASPAAFSAAFKGRFGQTPTAYRQRFAKKKS